jgi:hypothetical protein
MNLPTSRLTRYAALLALALPGLSLAGDEIQSMESNDSARETEIAAFDDKAREAEIARSDDKGRSAEIDAIDDKSEVLVSRELSNKIYKGDGTIDLLKNISGSNLARYFNQTGGLLLLGADLNESNSGNESKDAVGVAIRQAQLSISTTKGDFTFTDFFTSTSSKLREDGIAGEYATLVGSGGGDDISGRKIDAMKLDDVMWFENIKFEGEITAAKMNISFLQPYGENEQTASEEFFDFSAGFEQFALLNTADTILAAEGNPALDYLKKNEENVDVNSNDRLAVALKNADPGVETPPVNGGDGAPVATPPAAPAPPLVVLASMGLLMLWKKRNQPAPTDA